MSLITFDLFRIQTVPPNYSWDEGTPLVNYPEENLISELSSLSVDSNITPDGLGVPAIVGYAPFVYVALSSDIIDDGSSSPTTVATERIVNFGDYYNSDTNVVNSIGSGSVLFCHNYIMPGKYTVNIKEVNYVAKRRALPSFSDFSGLYIQPIGPSERLPLSWQWNNFRSITFSDTRNTPIRWEQTGFQKEEQLTWNDASGPCYEFELEDNNLEISAVDVFSGSKALLEVREILPTAYLSAIELTPNKESPLTVRLTPKFTKCGSFPIEKIVWDLGDGSPLLVQRRRAPDSESPFAFSNTLTADWQDPRNYDVIHTYKKLPTSEFSFYPSITAYAASTGTTNCASTVVGPLTLKSPATLNFKILQNELTNYGRAIVADVEGSIVAWNAPLTPNLNDILYVPLQHKWNDSLTWNDNSCWTETPMVS